MVTVTNREIATMAKRHISAVGRGAMSTDFYRDGFSHYGAPYRGHLPQRLANILDARFIAGTIRQVVYSYSTPIAWQDGEVWIRPHVSYSVTTAKHQGSLYPLAPLDIPADAGMDEYLRVLEGHAVFHPHAGNLGTYIGTGA